MWRLLICLFLLNNIVSATKGRNIADTSITIFPKSRVFPVVFLDPLECQINGGSYVLSQKDRKESLYSTVNLGFSKPIITKVINSSIWEFNFAAATFTQFDLIRSKTFGYLAGLVNNDYKISLDLSTQKNNRIFRFRIFHVSSHLGDDYMLRHNDSLPNDKSVNYEQAEITYLRQINNNYFFLSIGEVYTKYVFRERLSFQSGGLYNFKGSKLINLFTSVNVKIFAENNFAPDIRTAIGINFHPKAESIVKIWLEYYNGKLPYSTLDYGRVSWFGLALWLNIF